MANKTNGYTLHHDSMSTHQIQQPLLVTGYPGQAQSALSLHAPGISAPPTIIRAPADGQWTYGLCESLREDCAICAFAVFLPSCAYGLVYNNLALGTYEGPKFVCTPPCGAHFLLQAEAAFFKVPCGWVLSHHQRGGLRAKYGIHANHASACAGTKADICASLFCQPCALAQELLEQRSRLPHLAVAPAAPTQAPAPVEAMK